MLTMPNSATTTNDPAPCRGAAPEIALAKLLADAHAEFERLHSTTRRAGFEIVFRAVSGIIIDRPGIVQAGGAGQRSRGGLAPCVLRRVREHIEANLADRIELAELAEIAKLSRCHFGRAFKISVGCTPQRYVMSRRLEAARRQLRETERPIVDIALALGFADQSHLSRCFRADSGVSPLAYRRNRP